MKVSFFQYQNGLNNGDVINGCGLFLIINFCNFVLRLLLPNDTRQVLQRHTKLQSGAKKITKWGSFFRLQSGAAQKLQSGAKKSQSGLKNHKMGHSNGISLE